MATGPISHGTLAERSSSRILISDGLPQRANRLRWLFVVAICLASLAGCTRWREYVHNRFKVGPNYQKPDAQVADRWIDADNPTVSSAATNDAAWWRTFDDPTLNSLIYTAYRQNLTVRAAGMRILESRAQLGIAAGNLFPQTQQAFGDYTRTNTSKNSPFSGSLPHYDDWQLGANLAWELDFWGRFRRAVESANANLDASIETYDYALVLLLSEVAQRYIDIRTAEQRLVYARKNVDIQKKSLELAQVKFTNGATTKLDVTQGETTLAQTQATIPPLEATRRVAIDQLCILLGMPPRDLTETLGEHAIPSAPPQVVLGIPADLLRRRPDIRAVEREVAAQSAQIGIATAELYPHVSITGSIYFDSMRFKDLFNGNSMSGNVGPSFNWNILNYGRLVNNIRLQDARFQELVYTYQDTVLKANAEVEAALVNFLQSQQEVKYLAVSTAAATESVELVRDQYDAGKTDFNRVLTVEQQLTQQEDTLASAQGSVVQSLVQLYKALGGGWQIRLWGNGTPSDAATEAAPAESPNEVDVKQPGLDEPQENIAAPSPASANATSSKRPLPLPPAPVAQ